MAGVLQQLGVGAFAIREHRPRPLWGARKPNQETLSKCCYGLVMTHEYDSAPTSKPTAPMVAEIVAQSLEQLCEGNPVLITPLPGGALQLEVCFGASSSREPKLERLYTAGELMALWGYRSLSAFWKMIRREGVPTVELAARVVRFPESGLRIWIQRRTVGCGS
jgi:predicted DNA-binding transcriptional regulator AlpA